MDESVPSYSLVSTVSHGFLKYLTSKLLYRDDPFSEFYSSRPEFFFILPARTYFHLCLSTHNPEPVRYSHICCKLQVLFWMKHTMWMWKKIT